MIELLTTLGLPIIEAGIGAIGNIGSKKRLADIEADKVNISTPSSIQKYAGAPISEKYIQEIADRASQRVGTSISALQKGGVSTMGQIPTIMANEARNDQALQADYGDREKQALLTAGQYEARTQDAARQDWEQRMQGEQMRRGDMMQYLMGGLSSLGSNVLANDYLGNFDGMFSGEKKNNNVNSFDNANQGGGAIFPKRKNEMSYDNSIPFFDYINK